MTPSTSSGPALRVWATPWFMNAPNMLCRFHSKLMPRMTERRITAVFQPRLLFLGTTRSGDPNEGGGEADGGGVGGIGGGLGGKLLSITKRSVVQALRPGKR